MTWARVGALWERARASLGFLPAVGVTVALVVGVVLPHVESTTDQSPLAGLAFGGGPDAALSLLGAIASAIITVTSLTFSLTIVALQMASSQFSPRLLRTFSRDRTVQTVLALFLATFVYALAVLRTVRVDSGDDDPAFVPRVSVTLAILLALASSLALVRFLAHIASLMRVDTLMRDVHAQLGTTADRLYPADAEPGDAAEGPADLPLPGPGARDVLATTSGWVQAVDTARVAEAARGSGVVLRLDAGVGDHVVEGAPVGCAWDSDRASSERVDPPRLEDAVGAALQVGYERTPQYDAAFGLRQLVDIAAKALSPGVNDPTTAVHALGHLAAVLPVLARRPLGPQLLRDDDGRLRAVVRRPGFDELLDLACAQVRRYGAGEPAVTLALVRVLGETARVVGPRGHPARRTAVLEQVEQLEEAVRRETADARDRQRVLDAAARVRPLLGAPGPPP